MTFLKKTNKQKQSLGSSTNKKHDMKAEGNYLKGKGPWGGEIWVKYNKHA